MRDLNYKLSHEEAQRTQKLLNDQAKIFQLSDIIRESRFSLEQYLLQVDHEDGRILGRQNWRLKSMFY